MKKRAIRSLLLSLCLAAVMSFSGCDLLPYLPADLSDPVGEPDGRLRLEFLYVGQADCTLITLPSGEVMLVDGGNDADGENIADYLEDCGIERLDYVINTHPHEDHLGGLDHILARFEAGAIYMPQLPDSDIPETRNYEDFVYEALAQDCGLSYLAAGDRVVESSGLTVDCLSPESRDVFSSLNDYSIVLKITYGEDAFLLMGDAEQTAEEIMLRGGYDLDADLLKVGHHGSSTSSSWAFIEEVEPEYAIISCGVDNSYGHPHDETIDTLIGIEAELYDLSEVGTVVAYSDGAGITLEQNAALILDAA